MLITLRSDGLTMTHLFTLDWIIRVLHLWLIFAELDVFKTAKVDRRLDLLIVIQPYLDVVHKYVDDCFENAISKVVLLQGELLHLSLDRLEFLVAFLD